MRQRLGIAILFWALGTLTGCGGGEVTVLDRPAFDRAVARYLERHSMGLTIVEYESFDRPEGAATAEAVISMGDAAGMIKAVQRYRFEFEKTDAGWRVASAEQL